MYEHAPRPTKAKHHFATPWSVSSALAVPEPNFVKVEKIFPKKMAAAGLKRAEPSVEMSATAIAARCCRVVKANRERQGALIMGTFSAFPNECSSWLEGSGFCTRVDIEPKEALLASTWRIFDEFRMLRSGKF
jgi:hypothetical protein